MSHIERTLERVIVTGATSGLGRDIAKRFLADGAQVVATGRSAHKLAQLRDEVGSAGGRLVAVAGDLADPATGPKLAEAARSQFGGADILINSAGIFGVKPFLEVTAADVDRFYQTNARGTFLVSQAIVPLLIEAGGGAIVSIGTVLIDQPTAKLAATAALMSKAAVHALTRSLAIELAPHKIRVNAIAPGVIRTPLAGDDVDQMAGLQPLGRVGEPPEITDAALYLARAGFVTGAVLDVDGGYAHGR